MRSGALTILFCILIFECLSQQNVQFADWVKASETDDRLLPRYGDKPKTTGRANSDSEYVQQMLALPQFKTRRDASDHLIKLGFEYYYRDDLKTAMYRFNQAYLLDTSNSDCYWGYGAIYMRFGMLDLAADQYEDGLRRDSMNTHLWTDLATTFLGEYYRSGNQDGLDSAIFYLTKSYAIDPKDVNTVYKLSISHWNKSNCANAWRYYDEAVALGGKPITTAYTADLKKRCKKD